MGKFIREPMAVAEVMRTAWREHRSSGWASDSREPFIDCLRRAWNYWRKDRDNCRAAEAAAEARYADLPDHLTDDQKRLVIDLEGQIEIRSMAYDRASEREAEEMRRHIAAILAVPAAAQMAEAA